VAPLLTPWLGERLVLRQIRGRSPEHRVRRILKAISVDHHRVAESVVRAWIDVARRQQNETFPATGLVQTLRSVLRLFWMPTYRAVVDAVRAPTLVLHGEGDPIVPLSASRWLVDRRPDWTLEVLPDAGHAPQMERPELFVETVNRWIVDR
jgi:pimeloyl-ACP methyl ester carboxylesterase